MCLIFQAYNKRNKLSPLFVFQWFSEDVNTPMVWWGLDRGGEPPLLNTCDHLSLAPLQAVMLPLCKESPCVMLIDCLRHLCYSPFSRLGCLGGVSQSHLELAAKNYSTGGKNFGIKLLLHFPRLCFIKKDKVPAGKWYKISQLHK